MLKKVTLSNFVHFCNEQTFEFQTNDVAEKETPLIGGPFFLIGSNRSGKSSVFEAVRRCMSTSRNLFFSTRHDDDKPLVVICEYYDEKNKKDFYSCYIETEQERAIKGTKSDDPKKGPCEEKREEPGAIKIYFETGTSISPVKKIKNLSVDLLKKNKNGFPLNHCFEVDPIISSLRTSDKQEDKPLTIAILTSFVQKHIRETENYKKFIENVTGTDYNGDTPCEKSLTQNVDKQIVIAEPMIGISPMQWTKSKRFDSIERNGQNNVFAIEMVNRSEILAWYLDQNTKIKETDKEKVNKTFNILTNDSRVQFQMKEGKMVVIDNGNTVSLEKAPMGIYEAMICSILLSISEFKTVCLEEPGRGMHMQMIERLRDMILKEIKYKTVIIITHIPSFLSSWNMKNIFFCRGSINKENKSVFTSTKGMDILCGDVESKTRRIITNGTMATIFFAKRVLLVEGESDLTFMTQLKAILLENNDIVERIFVAMKKKTSHAGKFYQFLSALHIIQLYGEQNKLRLEKVCQALGLERYFLLDYDAIVRTTGNEETYTKFINDFSLSETLIEENIRKDVSVLEQSGLFVWKRGLHPGWIEEMPANLDNVKGGTIEYALFCLSKMNKDLETTLQTNNSELKIKPNISEGKPKTFTKLFKNKALTESNIREIVLKVIEISTHNTDSDVFRFLKFLIDSALEKNPQLMTIKKQKVEYCQV